MKALIQRVSEASITIDKLYSGSIGKGVVVLLGVTHSDTDEDVAFLAGKCVNLRIFEDENGKMNKSLLDVEGAMMIVSQFTLYGDASHGRRPGFTEAAVPAVAIPLYESFIRKCSSEISGRVVTGKFGADMQVSLTNDGPVTIMVESRK